MKLSIGIDPGQAGGIGFIGPATLDVVPMPDTVRDVVDLFENVDPERCHVFLEHVHSMPKQGVSSTFKFGKHFGYIIGIVATLRLPYELVTPRTWQGTMKCLSRGDKKITKARAQELFPQLGITHKTADAILIAEYGRRMLAVREVEDKLIDDEAVDHR